MDIISNRDKAGNLQGWLGGVKRDRGRQNEQTQNETDT